MILNRRTAKGRGFTRYTLRQCFMLLTAVGLFFGVLGAQVGPWFQHGRQRQANQKLVDSVRAGDLRAAREAIAAGADSWTVSAVLRDAIENSDRPMAHLLLDTGADLNQLANELYPPLYHPIRSCIEAGRVDMLALLLDNGARATPHDVIEALETEHYAGAKSRMVQLLLSHDVDIQAVLAVAARKRDVPLANALRQYGATFSPSIVANLGLLEELSRYVEQDPSILHQKFSVAQPGGVAGDTTLLSIALERADRDMSRFLIDAGASADVRVHQGCTLLHSATLGGDPELVKLLVDRGLNPDDDRCGTPPLFLAVRLNRPAAAAALISGGANVDARSAAGTTPLIEAVNQNRHAIVELLLAAGADSSLAGLDGRSAYQWAKVRRRHEILELLEQTRIDTTARPSTGDGC